MIKRIVIFTAISLLCLMSGQPEGRTKAVDHLVLYGSCDPEWLGLLANEFEKKMGIHVEWLRESTGVILQRLKTEKNSPKATVWFGGTFDGHAEAAKEGLLVPFTPSNASDLGKQFQNPLGNQLSIGVYGGILGFSVNTELLKKLGKPTPKSWDDLLNPTYKGLVAMANPNTSGTAYTALATIMKLKGEEKGIEYLQRLNQNIAQYTQSGPAPVLLAGKGEIAIAIVFLQDSIKGRLQGYRVEEVVPAEGTGYEIGGLSLVKGGPNLEWGKQFVEWVLSSQAQELAPRVGSFQVPANTKTKLDKNIIPFERVKLLDLPVDWLVQNRERFISLWTQKVFTKK